VTAVIYSAKWVLPVDGPPIEDGEIVVEEDRVASVRPRTNGGPRRDLGDAVLMPGLVNVHTHLEYTAPRGILEDIPFFSWIRALTALKPKWGPEDWLRSTRLGALEAVASGVTTIGDNADAGPTARVAYESGLRAVVYQEVFGPDPRDPVEPIMNGLRARLAAHAPFVSDRIRLGISPHALYTVRPELFAAVNGLAAREHLPISFHLAESLDESALILRGEGAFAAMYRDRGIAWAVPCATPTRYAGDLGALHPTALAVHCVQQTPEDIALLGESGAAIAHCPRSNAKLGAGVAPLADWLATPGLRVGLGTDSAVSNNAMDMFEEMRFALLAQRAIRKEVPVITAPQMVRLATLGGAEALGLSDRIGSLTPGKDADFIAVRCSGPHAAPVSDPYAVLVYSARASDVVLTVAHGEVLYEEGAWRTMDAEGVLREAAESRSRLGVH
jgi:5-methylthioadenosine/S-adenosylhomocysteine deaminase